VATTISAEEGALKRGAEAVGTAKAGIDQQLAHVRSEIEGVRAYWTGPAQISYNALMTRWDDESKKLNAVLITLQEAIQSTDRDQAQDEADHQQVISQLSNMMGA
jgi:WXG100 family type VII secretion target